jgi:hypothetical protein
MGVLVGQLATGLQVLTRGIAGAPGETRTPNLGICRPRQLTRECPEPSAGRARPGRRGASRSVESANGLLSRLLSPAAGMRSLGDGRMSRPAHRRTRRRP